MRRLRVLGLLLLLSAPARATTLFEDEGFLAFDVSPATGCPGTGECVGVAVSVAPGGPLADTILFDLQVYWDPSYWALRELNGAGVVARDDTLGYMDDVFADVGLGAPIPIGTPLFGLVFEVVGSPEPDHTVLQVGYLAYPGDFFTRAVLVADSSFQMALPVPNSQLITPEPGSGLLLGLGLFGLALRRRRRSALLGAALALVACNDGARVVDQRTFLWQSGSANESSLSRNEANPFRGRVAPSKPLRLIAFDQYGIADPQAIRYHEGDALPTTLLNPATMVTAVQPPNLFAVLPLPPPGNLSTALVDGLAGPMGTVLRAPDNIYLDLRNLPRVSGGPIGLRLNQTFPGRFSANPLASSGLNFSPDLSDDFGGDFSGAVPCMDPYSSLAALVKNGLAAADPTALCIESSSVLGGTVSAVPGAPGPDANGAFTPPGLIQMTGGIGELPMRPAPDLPISRWHLITRDSSGALTDTGAFPPNYGEGFAQGLFIPSRGMRLGQPMHWERNVDPSTGRPLVGRLDLEPIGSCAAAGESAPDPLHGAGLAYNSAFASHPFSVTPGSPELVSPSPLTIVSRRGGVGIDPGCLRPGGAPGGADAFAFDAASLDATNALANHHANLGLFASLCRSTLPFEPTIDASSCLFQLFASQAVLNRALLPLALTEQLGVLLAGEPTGNAGPQRLLGLIASAQKGAVAGAQLAPVPLAPLNALFNNPQHPFDRNLDGSPGPDDLGGFDGFDGRVQVTGRLDTPQFDENVVASFQTLDRSLSNEQRALAGCGPFYATRCDSSLAFRDAAKGIFWGGFGGLDLLNGEASALLEGVRPASDDGSNAGSAPQPGTVGYEGPPVCIRRVGGELVRLPGCRGVQALEVAQDGLGNPVIQIEFDAGYLPSVDGCVIGSRVRRADASFVPVALVGVSAGDAQLAAELALCNGALTRRVIPERIFVDGDDNGLPDTVGDVPVTALNPNCVGPAIGTGTGNNSLRVCNAALVPLEQQPLIHPLAGCVDSPAHFAVFGADDCRYWMNRDGVEELLAGTAQLFRSEVAALSWNLAAFLAVSSCDQHTPDAAGRVHEPLPGEPPNGPSIAEDAQCFDSNAAYDATRCSLATPQHCKNVKALLGLAPPIPAAGAADPDPDGDGVARDGDGSGVAGDRPCLSGEVLACDDNCGDLSNPHQLNSNGLASSGSDGFGNVCDPDLDNDGDVDDGDRLLQLQCFQTGTSASIDCADADLVGASLGSEPDPYALHPVDGVDRLQLLRWLRDPASSPGSQPAH